MISENDDKQRAADRAHLAWGFALSIPLTLLIWALMSHNFGLEKLLKMAQEPPELLTSTSIIHMDRRPIPVPNHKSAQPQVPVLPKPVVAQAQPATHRAQPTPATERAEIAREQPKAPPQAMPSKTEQRAASLAETLAQQQAAFQRETAALNANRAPLTNATIDPDNSPRSQETYKLDYSGLPHATGHGQGYIYPNQSWRDQGLDCYRGHYTFLYPDGGTEEANIPWPFCYPPYQDPLLRGYPRMIPFPPPMTGYRLPPGTQLERQEAEEYNYWLSTQRP
jgi:hypothetical protein